MAFELYKRTRAARDAGEESVSISSAGLIIISSALTAKFFKDATHALLYYDKAAKKVGIEPVKHKEAFSSKLIRVSNGKRVAVSGRGFLNQILSEPGPGSMLQMAELKPQKNKFEPGTFAATFEGGKLIFRLK